MKRREFLQAAGLGLATTAVAKPAIAQSNPAINVMCKRMSVLRKCCRECGEHPKSISKVLPVGRERFIQPAAPVRSLDQIDERRLFFEPE